MGCGKSSVGRILATLLPECRLIDLDTYIEEKQGRTIPEIFNEYGEAAFRRMEHEALEEIFNEHNRPQTILSLGGGTVISEACSRLVRENSVCFYLRATTDTLLTNLEGHSEGRPMLDSASPVRSDASADSVTDEAHKTDNRQIKSPKRPGQITGSDEAHRMEINGERETLRRRIESLMQTRSPRYLTTAHRTIYTDGLTFAQTAALIKEAMERNTLNIKQ